jgi:hypothetical protein
MGNRVDVKKNGGTLPLPIKISELRNSSHFAQVLRSARQLFTQLRCKSVNIYPDRTAEEQKACKRLLNILWKRKMKHLRYLVVKQHETTNSIQKPKVIA